MTRAQGWSRRQTGQGDDTHEVWESPDCALCVRIDTEHANTEHPERYVSVIKPDSEFFGDGEVARLGHVTLPAAITEALRLATETSHESH